MSSDAFRRGSDGSGKATVDQQENVRSQPRKRGIAGHCLMFWWAYLIAFLCVAILVICLVIFVAIPKIAQQKLNDAVLTIEGIVASNTQTDNLTLAINSTVYSNAPFSATIAAFSGDLYLEDLADHTPFVTVDFPQTTTAHVQAVNISQFYAIQNLDAFTAFQKWLLFNDTIRVTLKGNTNVRVKGISKAYGVTFQKTVTLAGLRGFEGLNVTQSTISLSEDAQGDNFVGYVTVPNYSVVTFDIGNATFDNSLNGTMLGPVYVDNMVIRPGTGNNFTMRANVNETTVLAAIQKQPYCSNGGVMPFTLAGKSIVNHGQTLPYYQGALAGGNLTTEINIGYDLKTQLNFTVSCTS